MPLVLANRVRETTTTTGTGAVSLGGAVSGFQGFNTAIGNTNTTYYTIVDAATSAWEVGLGTYTAAGSTLSRDTVFASSSGGALVPFAAGVKDVFVTQPSERAVYVLGAGTGLAAGAAAFTANAVPYANSTSTLATSANMTFNGTRLTVADLADSGLTSGRVVYASTGGSLVDSANLTFDGTSLTLGGNPTLSAGTANGVAYLNASKVLTTGSALTFDGTLLATTGNISLGASANLTWGGAYGAGIPTIAGSSGALLFYPNGSTSGETARVTSGGAFLVGTTTTLSTGGVTGFLTASTSAAATWPGYFENTNASPFGVGIRYATDSNATGNDFLYCVGNTTLRASIRSNGGVANYSGNNVNISDRREKTDFAPAGEYLSKICAIPVQTFKYIDQSEDDPGLTLGVVAQDVQAVAPELVMESNWGSEDEPKMRLSIYQTDLQYALMKCIQEQQALITSLTARIAALEA